MEIQSVSPIHQVPTDPNCGWCRLGTVSRSNKCFGCGIKGCQYHLYGCRDCARIFCSDCHNKNKINGCPGCVLIPTCSIPACKEKTRWRCCECKLILCTNHAQHCSNCHALVCKNHLEHGLCKRCREGERCHICCAFDFGEKKAGVITCNQCHLKVCFSHRGNCQACSGDVCDKCGFHEKCQS